MATYLGIGLTKSWGVESVYGTEVARTVTLDCISDTVQAKAANAVVEDLASYMQGPNEAVQTAIDVAGDTVANMAYAKNALGLLLFLAFGDVAESGSTGAYVHTFTPATAVPSASTETVRGTASGVSEEGYGIQISKLVAVFEQGKVAQVTITQIGKNTATPASPGTIPAAGTARTYIMGQHCPGIVFAGTTYPARKITLTIDNGLEGLRDLGSLNISEAVRSKRLEATIEVELTKRGEALRTAYKAKTQGTLAFTCTSGANVLAVSSPIAFIEEQSDPFSGAGTITETVRFRCLADPGNTTGCITVALTNADATYGAS